MKKNISGSFVQKDSGDYYKIENAGHLPPFFINIATASDLWVFLSSNGALTAGRQNADGAVFPYETDDRLHLSASTGPKTLIRLPDGRIWEPFTTSKDNPYRYKRNLYKRLAGDAVLFEEINETLGLTFSYRWETGEKYGIIRTAAIRNNSDAIISFALLDGVENIIPYGIEKMMADGSSCLTDSYKTSERPDSKNNLAIFSLTSTIVDTPKPMEILRANIAWYIGEAKTFLLSSQQIDAFASGEIPKDETSTQGRKTAYLAYQDITLPPSAEQSWLMILDARLNHKQISKRLCEINKTPQKNLRAQVENDIATSTKELINIAAVTDGLQCTSDKHADVRHYMNVLYNNMRGGVFLNGYDFNPALFKQFAASRDKKIVQRKEDFFNHLPDNMLQLHEKAYTDGDADIIRLSLEFLPLTFSRRHGDPSRPWNRFNIQVKDDEGNRLYHYEGNWRDIFQNWEAMALSFPGYIAPIIAKFLNASTADGFNPYRITQDGIDWEVPQPDNPFSGYGYWGDHQIVYLNKLLEWVNDYMPEALEQLMRHDIFTYAHIPYEIKPYEHLVKDVKNTLAFMTEKHKQLMERTEKYGTDGKLLANESGIYHAGFAEKLLVPILAKMSNLIPGGGIWMNTQRPEWNDANNAIVGYGLSMVTVYQLYRHLNFCKKIIEKHKNEAVISNEVVDWMETIFKLLNERAAFGPRAFMDKTGMAYGVYRNQVYRHGFSGKRAVPKERIIDFINISLASLVETISVNKREDGMYHGYNILTLTENSLHIQPLFLMLEAQTAVLGSGLLSPDDALSLVQAMDNSGLMSDEHNTFFLYPKKKLKTFMERNIIPTEMVQDSELIKKLIADGNENFVIQDEFGNVRFHDRFRQSADMENGLAMLKNKYTDLVASEYAVIRDIYETVFNHRQFTGRSGIMYKYEGIGSIYWHQNSKFILSFQEVFSQAAAQKDVHLKTLKDAYYHLRAGLGFNKEPSLWGAFPLEPYSHTPYGMPAQQPGMTGQVKEDILTRNAEMGLMIKDGLLFFEPSLLRISEFLTEPDEFNGLTLEAGTLAFMVCRVPVVYTLSDNEKIMVYKRNDEVVCFDNQLSLDAALSRSLFTHDQTIGRIEVFFKKERMI